jgi:hypothetical protein
VFVTNADGSSQLVGQTLAALPANYGMQRSTSYDCPDFPSQSAAQYYVELYPGDPSRLDGDHDGAACEDNPSPYGAEVVPPEPTPPQVTLPTSPSPACTVPAVVGLALDQATSSIAAADCSLGAVSYVYSPAVKGGLVISQSLAQGRVLTAHTQIDVVVSRGPRPLTLSRREAVRYMRAAVTKRYSRQPSRLELTNCTRLSPTTWTCAATWRDRISRYHGTVRTWIDQHHWYYSSRVTRRVLG